MNLKIFLVKSNVSSTPLAEIRTDGQVVEFVVDNTEGKLPQLVGKQFANLQDLIRHSSHLSLEQPKENIPNLLRYVMSNGDVVEITTDGRTCMLNGQLLSEEEKQELFQAIRNGELSVKKKTDVEQPVPVMPMPQTKMAPVMPAAPPKLNMGLVNAMKDRQKEVQDTIDSGNHYNDPLIEKADFSDTYSPEMTKQLAYLLVHGKYKGENPNG